MKNRTRLVCVALAALLVSSCGPRGIAIVSPADGSVGTRMPIDIEVFFNENAILGTLQVLLNGNDITSQLALDPPVSGRIFARATDVWDPAWLVTGLNQLVLSVEVFGVTAQRESYFTLDGDPYADAVPAGGFVVGTNGGFGSTANVLGPPAGRGLFQGSLDVLSLGLSGRVEVEFVDNVIVDGPGVDLTVFENSFLGIDPGPLSAPPFSEPGRVSVSQDGVTWYAFGACLLLQTEAPYHPGCAGVMPVVSDLEDPHPSIPTTADIEDLVGLDLLGPPIEIDGAGGDSFDLADVGLSWARYLRIDAAPFVDGPFGSDNAGFDLDAVVAVHSTVATDANQNGIPDEVE